MKNDTIIAANRFGLGARPGDLSDIDSDPRAWLLQQVLATPAESVHLQGLPASAAIAVEVDEARKAMRELRQADKNDKTGTGSAKKFASVARGHYIQQAQARFSNAAACDTPFHERLVHFWSNHFAVSADKQPLPALAGAFENEAIRPHVAGNFYDMLVAVEKHPAMILYLDNQRSVGPNSTIAKRASRSGRQKDIGLNENLAREILELHTLGVDGGYSQTDVTTFAKVITGWSVGGGRNRRLAQGTPGTFEYRDNIHEPGAHTMLGKTYQDDGVHQGEQVLRDLALHPSTASFIATKLCRHFIADEPPASAVDRVASVFLRTDGHLPSVHKALVEAGECWEVTFAKFKTPQDFLISIYRALDRVPENGRTVVAALDLMGQAPFRPGSPAGWPDTADDWGGADALYKRIEWSNNVGRLAGKQSNPLELADSVLATALGDHSRTAIARAESHAQGLTLLLMSPEFQRR